MDIICARCGKHLSSIEAAREHKCSSRSDDVRPSFKIAPGAKLSADEWNQIVKSLNISGPKPEPKEPLPPKEPEPKESLSTPMFETKAQKRPREGMYILLPVILVFSCTMIGFGISLFISTSRPLWVLLTFSIIYSIEKWGRKVTVNKAIGIPYKLFLNALVLSVLGYSIWFGIKLFTQSLQFSPMLSSLLFIGELVFFIWLCRVLSKNSWRLPSMKLTVFSLMVIAIVFAFAGIEPLSFYKDNIFNSISDYLEERQVTREAAEIAKAGELAVAEKTRIQAEVLAKAEAERKAEEVAKAEVENEKQTLISLSQLIYQLINRERVNHGLSSLQISPTLTSLAEEHSKEMVDYDYFSHDRMPNSRPFDWNLQPGFGRGENIFMMPRHLLIPGPLLTPNQLANEIVQGWMDSPGHRQNILEGYFVYTGIGIDRKGDYYYITQIFEGNF